MSIAQKNNQFRVEIRRENLQKILKRKKADYYISQEVNLTFQEYLKGPHYEVIPRACAQHFELINTQSIAVFKKYLGENRISLDFKRPVNIAFINKFALLKSENLQQHFQEITAFAGKIGITMKGNQKLLIADSFLSPQRSLREDLIYYPNCLLEYWAIFFDKGQGQISTSSYCTIFRLLLYWLEDKTMFEHLNKYSVCYFIKNFLKYQNFKFDLIDLIVSKNIQELHLRVKKSLVKVIIHLIETTSFYDQMFQIIVEVIRSTNQIYFQKSFFENFKPERLIDLILHGIQNENLYINKQNQHLRQDFFFQSPSDEIIKHIQKFSIQQILFKSQNTSTKIWVTKIKALQVISELTQSERFMDYFFSLDFERVIAVLANLYLYCTQRNGITNTVQSRVVRILFNIIILAENLLFVEENVLQVENSVKIQYFTPEQKIGICERLKTCINDKIKIKELICCTKFDSHFTNILELVQLLKQISEFLDSRQVDMEILDQGRLIQNICNVIVSGLFNQEEEKIILTCLFELILRFKIKEMDFSNVEEQLYFLTNPVILSLISCQNQELLDEVIAKSKQKTSSYSSGNDIQI